MIGQLNHIAIAVPNLEEAANVYRNILGAKVTDPVALPEHGVTTVLWNYRIQKSSCLKRLVMTHRLPGLSSAIQKGACIIFA